MEVQESYVEYEMSHSHIWTKEYLGKVQKSYKISKVTLEF